MARELLSTFPPFSARTQAQVAAAAVGAACSSGASAAAVFGVAEGGDDDLVPRAEQSLAPELSHGDVARARSVPFMESRF